MLYLLHQEGATLLERILKNLVVLIKTSVCTRLILSFEIKNSPESELNPELKAGNLNPKTFESREFCSVNAFLLNPDNFPPAII